jgi:hypothetical protein
MTTNKKSRHIGKLLRFSNDELEKIKSAVAAEHLPFAVWCRQVLVDAATKLETARKDGARLNWRAVRAKKLLESLKDTHVHQ